MKKKQGFAGQKTLELSQEVINHYLKSKPNAKFGYFTKLGFFPEARHQLLDNKIGSDDYILVYCTNGYGVAQINQKTYHISLADFIIIPAKTKFSYQADELNAWSIFWFHFKGETFEDLAKIFIKKANSNKGFLPYSDDRIVLFNSILQNLEKGYGEENLTFLNLALLNLLSSFALNANSNSTKQDKWQQVINSSIRFMKANCEGSLALEDIAKHVGVSVSHFSLIFKKKIGVSPINYFHQIKIQKACEYLKYTDILIKEIAFKIGILDTQYFSRLFTKIIGVSPNQYRKNESPLE
jgi:AraC-like DNA-binding protein